MKIPVAVPAVLVSCLFAVSPATAQVCGDNVRDPGEQCDDGATHNMDGCSAACQFEQVHKIIDLNIDRTVGTCPANRFGGAFTIVGASQTNPGIDTSIELGATAILLDFLGLEDPAADDDADGLEIGIVNSTPVLAPGYDGNAATDQDWWYTPAGSLLDADRLPVNRLASDLTAGAVTTTTPGSADIGLILSGSPTLFSFSNLTLNMSIGADSAPLVSATGSTPGHLAAEQLDPALLSFGTAGAGNSGVMCGNISAISMALTPIPAALIPTCVTPPPGPTPVYTAANSLLDVFVSGCTAVIGIPVALINPAQPDREVPGAPDQGTGFPYLLTPDPITKVVTACHDKDGGPVPLLGCLADASYSSHFRFTSQRVIARDDLIFADGFDAVI
jgi:cysteine-rich repeat protein